nr:hypothetical protein [Nocardia sp.]
MPSDSDLAPILGDAGAPVIGHLPELMRFGRAAALLQYARYGPVSWTSAFGRRIVFLSGPDATQLALANKDKAFSTSGWKFFMEKFFQRGIKLMDFDESAGDTRSGDQGGVAPSRPDSPAGQGDSQGHHGAWSPSPGAYNRRDQSSGQSLRPAVLDRADDIRPGAIQCRTAGG